MPFSSKVLQRITDAGDDPYDWESESDNESADEVDLTSILDYLRAPTSSSKPAESPSPGDEKNIWKPASIDADLISQIVDDVLPTLPSIAKPNDVLCAICSSLNLTPEQFIVLPSEEEEPNKFGPYTQLGMVKEMKVKSAHCPFCRLVLGAVFKRPKEMPEVDGDGKSLRISMCWVTRGPIPDRNEPWKYIPKVRVLMPVVEKDGEGEAKYYRDFQLINTRPDITLLANDAPPSTTAIAKSYLIRDQIDFNMVRNWLWMCDKVHGDLCSHSRVLRPSQEVKDPATQILVFRVIDVVDECVILAPHDCVFVALSYVWGKIDIKEILRLLKENVSQMAKPGSLKPDGGYYKKIPKTIQDAMYVVKKMGLRYLWADSLCIIQDDDMGPGSTKAAALKNMDLVYGTAYVTIIAASGIDAHAGLAGTLPGTRGAALHVEEIVPGFRLAHTQAASDILKEENVHNTRAWTYQEILFSRRKLIFTGGQVRFECQPDTEWTTYQFYDPGNKYIVRVEPFDPDVIWEYTALIDQYVGLSLSYRTDIYNAFAGFTRFFNTELGVGLTQGIPDKYFDWFLLWGGFDSWQTRGGNAPSWSWAGWSGLPSARIWDFNNHSAKDIRETLRTRTWIIWYQRKAHNSEECVRVWEPRMEATSNSRGSRNFYGGHIRNRFPFDCAQTVPSPRILVGAPQYEVDTYSPSPGSGFLQFWTVSVTFNLAQPATTTGPSDPDSIPESGSIRLGIFGNGNSNIELGIIYVHSEWCKKNAPGAHEFILICEGRDVNPMDDVPDDESGEEDEWKYYMVMLIEWQEDRQWAERVSIGWIRKRYLFQSLGGGPAWKEIVLG